MDADKLLNEMMLHSPPYLHDVKAEHLSGMMEEGCQIMERVARSCMKQEQENISKWDTDHPPLKRL